MDSISTVRDAFERVIKRQKLYHSVSEVVIDRVCEVILETLFQIRLAQGTLEPKDVFTEFRLKLDSFLPLIELQGSQKEMNTSLCKYEEVVDISYNPDISQACRNIEFDVRLVNKILIEHFYRQGLFEVGDCLVKEAGEEEEETVFRSQSLEIYQIVESMKLRDIDHAMRWISMNREKLEQNGSKLELKLLSLKYCDILREGNLSDALKYGRTHFPQYGSLHIAEIGKLFTALLWIGKLEKSPYVELVSPSNWDKVTKELTKQYYNLLDQPSNSLLPVVLSAGFESLPTLLKLVHVMGLKKQEWQVVKELPVPLELGNEFQFHSVFVCPVNRDQSSKENPPMMLPCRHVLCKQSIMKLGKNCNTRRFKCPFCPAQTSASACRELYF